MRSGQTSSAFASILAFLTLLAIVPAQRLAARLSDSAIAGARVYGAVCGRCHNPRSPLERTDDEWIIIVNHMRIRGNLTGTQTRSVLAFLQSTNLVPSAASPASSPGEASGRPPSQDPDTIRLGRELTMQKACVGCHIIGDAGGQVFHRFKQETPGMNPGGAWRERELW